MHLQWFCCCGFTDHVHFFFLPQTARFLGLTWRLIPGWSPCAWVWQSMRWRVRHKRLISDIQHSWAGCKLVVKRFIYVAVPFPQCCVVDLNVCLKSKVISPSNRAGIAHTIMPVHIYQCDSFVLHHRCGSLDIMEAYLQSFLCLAWDMSAEICLLVGIHAL